MTFRRSAMPGLVVALAAAGTLFAGETPAGAVSCKHEPYGPYLQHDLETRYIDYGFRAVRTSPVEYAIRIQLQEKINGHWYDVDSGSRSGVSKSPALYRYVNCGGYAPARYRAVQTVWINGRRSQSGANDGIVLNCVG